jgi:uncharacterized cofD-like protein
VFQSRKITFSNKYLLPGLKRWIVIFIAGVSLILFGLALVLELRPLTQLSSFAWKMLRTIANIVPAQISGPVILILGAALIIGATLYTFRTMINVTMREAPTLTSKDAGQAVLQALERASRRGHGPKIVAMGGGTGLSTLLRGLKKFSSNLTAIVAVGDDGGSSGRLRQELKVVPPGDIRNCIVALADEEEVATSLFQYRFQEGSLKGHSLGNLFLAALCDISGDMAKATQVATRILRTVGTVLPSASEAIHLKAEMDNGEIVEGESNIPNTGSQIKRVFADNLPAALKESIDAINEAELIILGPGSLFTSIIPNLLLPEFVQAIQKSKAKTLYVCNLVQDKETQGFMACDFLKAIQEHTIINLIDAILINAPESWTMKTQQPIQINQDEISKMGVEIIIRSKLHDLNGGHSSLRLARSIIQWFNLKSPTKEQSTPPNPSKQQKADNSPKQSLIGKK